MRDNNIVELLRRGLCVTINSDDPAYFGGNMTDNFRAVAESQTLRREELALFTRNAIDASFVSEAEKCVLREKLDGFVATA